MGLVLGLLGQRTEAAEVYRHCSQLDGSGLKDPRTHEATKISALFNLGRLYADDGHFERAIDVYQEAVERMPSHYQPQVSEWVSHNTGVLPRAMNNLPGVIIIVGDKATLWGWRKYCTFP